MEFDYLYAPKRAEYHSAVRSSCVFCDAWHSSDDDANQILYKDEACFAIMNKYPYAPGHFMIIPAAHESNLERLDTKVWLRIALLAQVGVKTLKEEFKYPGVNIGMNLGAAAGAGIAEHLHLHILPRYERDTNFITTIAKTRVYCNDADDMFVGLKIAFTKMLHKEGLI